MDEATQNHIAAASSEPKMADKAMKLRPIGVPAPQTYSRFLSLPGELRNRIYQWTFQDGRKSDLALLLACRTIYLESNMLAFTQTTIKVILKGSYFEPTMVQFPGRFEDLPDRYRNVVNTVKLDCQFLTPMKTNREFARHRLFPVHIVHSWPQPTNASRVCYVMRDMYFESIRAAVDRRMSPFFPQRHDPFDFLDSEYSIFGSFLINSRLRTQTVRFPHTLSSTDPRVVGVRENIDGSTMASPNAYIEHGYSNELESARWLGRLQVTIITEEPRKSFLVQVEHQDLPEKEPVRVRFTLQGVVNLA